jgi:hypothetical protein
MKSSSKRLAVFCAAVATVAVVAVPVALSVSVTFGGTLSPFDHKQHDRLVRDGFPSTCHGKANPGLLGDGIARSYDRYRLTNPATTATCVHVFLQHLCEPENAFAQANSSFFPGDPSAHYLGDAGQSASPESFSFLVGAGHSFDVVVAEVDGGHHALPCPYRLTVSDGGTHQLLSVTGGATD